MRVWAVEWLARDSEGRRLVPAFTFLRELPTSPRTQLLAIVDAVRSVGPDQWRDPNTHRAMKGPLSNLHEARDKHGAVLYRLFLLWQRDAHRLVIVDGRSKANSTKLTDSDYEQIRQLAATAAEDPAPFAVADDFARAALEG